MRATSLLKTNGRGRSLAGHFCLTNTDCKAQLGRAGLRIGTFLELVGAYNGKCWLFAEDLARLYGVYEVQLGLRNVQGPPVLSSASGAFGPLSRLRPPAP